MAATISALANVRQNDDAGVRRKRIMQFTGDASYLQASGTVINPADVGLGWIEYISMPIISNGSTTVYFSQITYNSTTSGTTLAGSVTITFYSATATLVGNGDLSTFTAVFEVSGR